MDLNKAKEIAALELGKSNIVVVLSNKSIFNLENESELENVKEYANANKYEVFVVKNEVVAKEVEPKKKK